RANHYGFLLSVQLDFTINHKEKTFFHSKSEGSFPETKLICKFNSKNGCFFELFMIYSIIN
ncbi:hypothetical protein, partial [Ruthenibacterium lactatiformans]|uniref:hypothetical protein n=2 Tax=Ruthenibacterium lactatiformans TaxID=1550024 RepID=UPI0029428B6B